MRVPETTIHKNHGLKAGENNIGLARKVFAVKSVPEAPLEKFFSKPDFRFGILSSNSRHIAATGCFIVNISHRSSCF